MISSLARSRQREPWEGSPAVILLGEIQRSGSEHRTGTAAAGHASPARCAITPRATRRPLSAAASAGSAPCSTLPAANSPGMLVLPSASVDGPMVPRSSSAPPSTASSWSGIQSALSTSTSQLIISTSPVARSLTSTARNRSSPWMALSDVKVSSRVRCSSAAPARTAAKD